MTAVVDIVLLAFMVVTAVAVMQLRSLFAAVMIMGIFSLLSAAVFTQLDAVDVALTEASVGAGVSTVLLLGTLALTATQEEKPRSHRHVLALLVVLVVGAALLYGTRDMPDFGDPDTPVHTHVARHYIEQSEAEIGVPNIVTSVLASYRGYDTLGETVVVFTAAIGVLLLLARREGADS